MSDDQPLALVQWTAGQTQPTQIIDLRTWAGPGGIIAKDELALTFLDDIATKVSISNTTWQRVLGQNDVPAWSPSGKEFPIAMTVVSAGRTFWTVTGSVTVAYEGPAERVDVDVQIIRGYSNATIPYDPATELGALLPEDVRKTGARARILNVRFTGAGSTVECAAIVSVGSGALSLRGENAGTDIRVGHEATLSFSYTR
ncbi:hypothetical protein [Arthrobacter sp. RCC_34]|uniref:hypothetical protein n=1 Tax=Arthrobacter sp. RCC_34 TaxID=3239230 RepID=UPI0035260585